jgi:hypothetical protein
MDATVTLSVEQAADPGATWVEEAIAYSLGKGSLARRVERWLLDPLFRGVVRRQGNRALRCLAEPLAQEAGAEPGAPAIPMQASRNLLTAKVHGHPGAQKHADRADMHPQ